MKYAQIKDGIVVNRIVLEDESLDPIFSKDYDYFIRVDILDPEPGIGWLYDGSVFTAPETPEE